MLDGAHAACPRFGIDPGRSGCASACRCVCVTRGPGSCCPTCDRVRLRSWQIFYVHVGQPCRLNCCTQTRKAAIYSHAMTKLISWNLLRLTGATLDDVVRLIRREDPDLLLMQEATREMDGLTAHVGGQYQRNLLPGRVHGLAVWSPGAAPVFACGLAASGRRDVQPGLPDRRSRGDHRRQCASVARPDPEPAAACGGSPRFCRTAPRWWATTI